MLGVAIDPSFAESRFIYVFMASDLGDRKMNRLVRLIVDTGYTAVSSRKDIVTDIPYKSAATIWGGRGAHSGGRIRFSPLDGFLYVTTGDNHNGLIFFKWILPAWLPGTEPSVAYIPAYALPRPGS
jgi:aldose sugar dehydrogenase